jgi:hypothetical protein
MTQSFDGKPVSVLDWILTLLIISLPFINLIMLLVWAFDSSTNPSKANFAKASLIWMLISVALGIMLFSFIIGLAGGLSEFLQSYL